ncbi:MAG: NADH-quinone oxidoreductase subunit J [Puniceicoccaceae bacterium]
MDLIFAIFAALTVIPAFFMVIARNPVNGAMFMILSLVGMAALFVLLEAFFVAVLQVLVYAGAVMVLFLFIIMLLDMDEMEQLRPRAISLAAASIAGLLLIFGAVAVLQMSRTELPAEAIGTGEAFGYTANLKAYGYALFTRYMLPFQLTGVLLLIAMVGVIVVSKRANSGKEKEV